MPKTLFFTKNTNKTFDILLESVIMSENTFLTFKKKFKIFFFYYYYYFFFFFLRFTQRESQTLKGSTKFSSPVFASVFYCRSYSASSIPLNYIYVAWLHIYLKAVEKLQSWQHQTVSELHLNHSCIHILRITSFVAPLAFGPISNCAAIDCSQV